MRSRFLMLAAAGALAISLLTPLFSIRQARVEARQHAHVAAYHALSDTRMALEEAAFNLLEHLWWLYDAGLTLLEGEQLRPYHRWTLERTRTAVFRHQLCFALVTDPDGRTLFSQPPDVCPPELLDLARSVYQLAPPAGSSQGVLRLSFGQQGPVYCLVRAEQVLAGDQPVGAVLVGRALDKAFLEALSRRLEPPTATGVSSTGVLLLNLDGRVVAAGGGRPAVVAGLPNPGKVAALDIWEGEIYLDGARHQTVALPLRDPHGRPVGVLMTAVPEKPFIINFAARVWKVTGLTIPLALAGTLVVVWLALRLFLDRPLARLKALLEATVESLKNGVPLPETIPDLPAELAPLANGIGTLGGEFQHRKARQEELATLTSRLARAMSAQEGLAVLAHHLRRIRSGGEGVDAMTFHLLAGGGEGGIETFVEKPEEIPGCTRFPETPGVCPAYAAGSFAVQDAAAELPCPHFGPGNGSYHCRTLSLGGRVLGVLHLYSNGKNFFQGEINAWIEELTEYSLPIVANLFLLEETARLSATDALTGVYNRRFLEAFLEQQLALFARTGQSFAVLMLDLDHFKSFNDTFGHRAGDAALRAVAQALHKNLRAADVVARYGGEEFVVVLPGTDAGAAFEIAERLRQVVAETSLPDPQCPGEFLPPLTVSVGVAACPAHATALGALLHAADAAMYTAKRAGRNRTVVARAE
ncbi:MAG: hypothetical protein PWP65_786 [Clostridia bacterium]|nr:hypothetical protein [Clostridia bacterium]